MVGQSRKRRNDALHHRYTHITEMANAPMVTTTFRLGEPDLSSLIVDRIQDFGMVVQVGTGATVLASWPVRP